MFKRIVLALGLAVLLSTGLVDARKSALSGYGQISCSTGRSKTNVVSGYTKSSGAYVSTYARS